jgi:translation initiation factor 2 subunit 3
MDAALLLIAANETFPQPQTLEHLAAVEIMRLRHIIVLQNKIDLVTREAAMEQFHRVVHFLKRNTPFASSPIIPISAQKEQNIDCVLEFLCHVPIPQRDFASPCRMHVVRSFDINKPGDSVEDLAGGVVGGVIAHGVIHKHQQLEIRPGIVTYRRSRPQLDQSQASPPQLSRSSSSERQIRTFGDLPEAERTRSNAEVEYTILYTPLSTYVASLRSEAMELDFAIPGGLVAIGTTLDPTATRQNRLRGHLVGAVDSLPEVFSEFEIQFFLLPHIVGVRAEGCGKHATLPAPVKIAKVIVGETLRIGIRTLTCAGTVSVVKKELAKISLSSPVCCSVGDRLTLSRLVGRGYRLIGWGSIRRGVPVDRA